MDRVIRPKMRVLPDSSMITQVLTHTVVDDQPYYLTRPAKGSEPAGILPAGSKVQLISKGRGATSLVKDTKGREVYTAVAGLRPIE